MRETRRAPSRTKWRYAKKVKKTIRTRKRKIIKRRGQERKRMRGGTLPDLHLTHVTIARLQAQVNRLRTQVAGLERRCCSPLLPGYSPRSPEEFPDDARVNSDVTADSDAESGVYSLMPRDPLP